jgi:hypothetical protein
MVIPVWLTLGVGILALAWGAYRIRIALRSDQEDERARAGKGLFALARRTHFLVGVIYLLLGGALLATSFGWNPIGNLFVRAEAPVAPRTPRSVTLPLPAPPPSKPSAEPSKPAESTPAEPVDRSRGR